VAEIILSDGEHRTVIPVKPGETVYGALVREGAQLDSYCGGSGTCGKCRVRVLQGAPPVTPAEEAFLSPEDVNEGLRLACYLAAEDGMVLETLGVGPLEVVTGGAEREVAVNPLVRQVQVGAPESTIHHQRDIAARVGEAAGAKEVAPQCLPALAHLKAGEDYSVVVRGHTIIHVREGFRPVYGIAVDIGTTTMAAYLMDLATGKEVAVESMANPQRSFGADVISRIAFSQSVPEGVPQLQKALVEGLNHLTERLCQKAQVPSTDIYLMTVVGNTVMLHTLLGVSALSIANAPFVPVFSEQLELEAKELGIDINPLGEVVLLPSVSGYVGADIIADMLVCGLESQEGFSLLIDVGTNGEIVLGNKERFLACSAAAGPAFEGANLSCGMAGVPGAISAFRFVNGRREFEVIGGGEPKGICGSGLIDIVAELLRCGFLDDTGAFVGERALEDWQRPMLKSKSGMAAFAVTEDILLTQRDVRELQLAKGAVKAGILTLLKEAGITSGQVAAVYLAGGFGSHINVKNACTVGLFPKELEDRVVQMGNGAGAGAKMCLLDKSQLQRAAALKGKVEYIELSTRTDFQSIFMETMLF
jgi:uncharacterized 2Fe-2S/4Fe-4S cluster protein (DUF4445 family)